MELSAVDVHFCLSSLPFIFSKKNLHLWLIYMSNISSPISQFYAFLILVCRQLQKCMYGILDPFDMCSMTSYNLDSNWCTSRRINFKSHYPEKPGVSSFVLNSTPQLHFLLRNFNSFLSIFANLKQPTD
jgi:hypothetical protein